MISNTPRQKLFWVILLFIPLFVKSQKQEIKALAGIQISNINHTTPSIDSRYNLGFDLGFEFARHLSETAGLAFGFGYVRAGSIELYNAGFAKDNPEFLGQYPAWSVVTEKRMTYLNCLQFQPRYKKLIADKWTVGVGLQANLFIKGTIKKKYNVSGASVVYPEILWLRNTTEDKARKICFAPNISLDYQVSKKYGIRFIYTPISTSVYKSSRSSLNGFGIQFYKNLRKKS